MILAHGNIFAWVKLGAALTNDDGAALGFLIAIKLDAQTAARAITTGRSRNGS